MKKIIMATIACLPVMSFATNNSNVLNNIVSKIKEAHSFNTCIERGTNSFFDSSRTYYQCTDDEKNTFMLTIQVKTRQEGINRVQGVSKIFLHAEKQALLEKETI